MFCLTYYIGGGCRHKNKAPSPHLQKKGKEDGNYAPTSTGDKPPTAGGDPGAAGTEEDTLLHCLKFEWAARHEQCEEEHWADILAPLKSGEAQRLLRNLLPSSEG